MNTLPLLGYGEAAAVAAGSNGMFGKLWVWLTTTAWVQRPWTAFQTFQERRATPCADELLLPTQSFLMTNPTSPRSSTQTLPCSPPPTLPPHPGKALILGV